MGSDIRQVIVNQLALIVKLVTVPNGRNHPNFIRFLGTIIRRLMKSIHVALADLGLGRVFVVYPGTERYVLNEKVEALHLRAVGRPFPWEEP